MTTTNVGKKINKGLDVIFKGCSLCGGDDGREVLLCDGTLADDKPCPSVVCFSCAGITTKPEGDWFCKNGVCGKRSIALPSTPQHAKQAKTITVSPGLREKVLAFSRLAQVPTFPGSSSSASATGGIAHTGIEGALLALTDKIELMHKEMVTVDALSALKADLLAQFEAHISVMEQKYSELEQANRDLRVRVENLESQLKSVSVVGPDPAYKRISFIGFTSETAIERIRFISAWMNSNFSGVPCSVGNISRGPMRSRTLTKVSYAEFSDTDTRNIVLSQLRNNPISCESRSVSIQVKPALSQVVRSRIWALNKAFDMISVHASSSGKQVTKVSNVDARCVKVDNVIVFEQRPGSNDLGTFSGNFSTLTLPTGRSGVVPS